MFTERLNHIFADVCRTTTGEFSKLTQYDRSYVSHLRNGDRIPKPGRQAADRLVRAIYVCAAEKNALDTLCACAAVSPDAGDDAICAAVAAWLFDGQDAAQTKRREAKTPARRLKSSFGDRLGLAMETANISSIRLARSLNVDASLIAKYKSGLRVPRVNHPIIRGIAKALTARIFALDRSAALARLVGASPEELGDESAAAKRLEDWLRDFQAVDTSLIEGFLEGVDAFVPDTKLPLLPLEAAVDAETLQDGAESYDGIDGLRRAVLRFLGSAVKERKKELRLYSDQSIDWMVGDRGFAARWTSLMSAYVREGGKICIVHNVDRGLGEMIAAIQSWLPLYLSGGIESYYCLRSGGERFSHTLFLAPGSACIAGIHPAGMEQRARYRYSTDADELMHYGDFFDDLLAECRPLLTMNRNDGTQRLHSIMKDRAVHVVFRSLSLGTMPEKLLQRILERSALPEKTADKIRADWANRRELLCEKLRDGEIRECIVLPEEQALFAGNVAVDTTCAELCYTPEEYGEHIRAVLKLCEQEPGYHIYPLEEPPFERLKLLISDHVTMIVCPPDYTTAFTATHPLMCRAFADFVGRLEKQYNMDRLTLKNRLMQYTEFGGGKDPTEDEKRQTDRKGESR